MLAVAAQIFAWMRGPEITMLPPDKVALYADIAPEGSAIVRVAATMSYANLAQPTFGALVTAERSKLTIGNMQSEQHWNAFGFVGRAGANVKITSDKQALPQALPGQSFESHFTLFTPLRRQCTDANCNPTMDYISPAQLQATASTADRIRFDFSIETIHGDKITSSCDVILHDLTRKLLANLANSAVYARCHAPES